jgi:hypothetical protein
VIGVLFLVLAVLICASFGFVRVKTERGVKDLFD